MSRPGSPNSHGGSGHSPIFAYSPPASHFLTQMPSFAADKCLSSHNLAEMGSSSSIDSLEKSNSERRMLLVPRYLQNGSSKTLPYGTNTWGVPEKLVKTLRFQVLVWHVGALDVIQGQVVMKFRVSLFWNDDTPNTENEGMYLSRNKQNKSQWRMQGRHKAYNKEFSVSEDREEIDVPAVSILNAVSFEMIGEPEIVLLREKHKLMRWTCMYRATLIQEDIRVDNYPHDKHAIILKLGILQNRGKGARWDRNVWKMALATEYDSQGSTREPHGLLVDHVKIPEFKIDKKTGLNFQLKYLDFFKGISAGNQDDRYLEVKLNVTRESTYYDNNIIPVLCALDIVASFLVATLDATQCFQRGLLLLNTAFLELTTRMRVDGFLPNVGYQIKLQRVLNFCFFKLIALTIESCFVYYLVHEKGMSIHHADTIDFLAVFVSLVFGCRLLWEYYDVDRDIETKIKEEC